MHNLSFYFNINGTSVAVNKRDATKWSTRAADAGYVDVMHNLGVLCIKGNGIAVYNCKASNGSAVRSRREISTSFRAWALYVT